MSWPIMLRKTHLAELVHVRREVDSEKSWLRTQMEERLAIAVDGLPEKQMELDKLISITVKAHSGGMMEFISDMVSIHVITKITRELATSDVALNAILAQQLGDALRRYIEQEKNVNVPALFADVHGISGGE